MSVGSGASMRRAWPVMGCTNPRRLGVKGLAGERGGEPAGCFASVDGITYDRMADFGEMDPDLVGAPGFEPAGEQAGPEAEVLDHFVMRDRRDAVLERRVRCRGGRRHGRPREAGQSFPGPIGRRRRPRRDMIARSHASETGPETAAERSGRADEKDHAGSQLVDPVNDADIRAREAAFLREITAGALKERVALAIGGGLSQETGGLVDDQDIAVLEEDSKPPRDRLGSGAAGMISHRSVRLNVAGGVEAGLAGDVDVPALDGDCACSPRKAELHSDPLVQAHGHSRFPI